MQFNEFASLILPLLEMKDAQQVDILADLLKHVDKESLAVFIYLCQGRLGPPTKHLRRAKGWPTEEIVLKKLRYSASPHNKADAPNLMDVYRVLKSCIIFDDISRYQGEYSALIMKNLPAVSEDGLNLIALIFSKGIFKDSTIIKALAKLGGGGLGADKSINKLYRRTIPDLGKVADILRD